MDKESAIEILENASRKIALMTNETPERVYNDIINLLRRKDLLRKEERME